MLIRFVEVKWLIRKRNKDFLVMVSKEAEHSIKDSEDECFAFLERDV